MPAKREGDVLELDLAAHRVERDRARIWSTIAGLVSSVSKMRSPEAIARAIRLTTKPSQRTGSFSSVM